MEARLFWEDCAIGRVFELGAYKIDREEVIDFARRFDPQPFHIDDEQAARSLFRRLCASGVHTISIMSRLTFDGWQKAGIHPVAGGGLDASRFSAPVYPGDTLSGAVEIVDARPLRSRADRGLVKVRTTGKNQDDQVVISFLGEIFLGGRAASGG